MPIVVMGSKHNNQAKPRVLMGGDGMKDPKNTNRSSNRKNEVMNEYFVKLRGHTGLSHLGPADNHHSNSIRLSTHLES